MPQGRAATSVIGHNGLLGSAVCRALLARGIEPLRPEVRWGTPDVGTDLAAALEQVSAHGPWQIAWCAGAGVTATPQPVFDEELATFTAFIDQVLAADADQGTFFFASSAGALYAGSAAPPFTEHTPVRPLAPYGFAKAALEAQAARLAEVGCQVAIGRISNLYGPGQDLTKPQGLISQLCLATQARRPVGIYVPLDTLRDYLFVEDAGGLICDYLARVSVLGNAPPADTRCRARPADATANAGALGSAPIGALERLGARIAGQTRSNGETVVKILASQRSASIGEILGVLRRLGKRRPLVILAASPAAAMQSRDLRFRSVVFPELDARQLTPLPVGIAATLADVGARWRAAAE